MSAINRAEKRAFEKKAKKVTGDKELINVFIATRESKENSRELLVEDGDKVRLDTELIMNRSHYKQQHQRYKDFVESNGNRVFTARHVTGVLFELEEGKEFLFLDSELIKVEEAEAEV